MNYSSPDYLRLSLAAAMTLGLKKGRFHRNAKLHCLNLLLTYPNGCRAACSYCGLSRDSGGKAEDDNTFIRVEWPTFSTDEIIERAVNNAGLERACISSLTHPHSSRDTLTVLKKIKDKTVLPVSILSNPTTTRSQDIREFKEHGADRFTVAIDLATESLFNKNRGEGVNGGHKWGRYWRTLEEASTVFGQGHIGVHLIAGMGETQQEMFNTIQMVRDRGGTTHLFSFYPECGSSLENATPCDSGHYRQVQLGRYLIDNDHTRADKMEFDEQGVSINMGASEALIERIINSGKPFQTCGCPGANKEDVACNRPYGDGPPTDIRSYPFTLEESDVDLVRVQLEG